MGVQVPGMVTEPMSFILEHDRIVKGNHAPFLSQTSCKIIVRLQAGSGIPAGVRDGTCLKGNLSRIVDVCMFKGIDDRTRFPI